MSERLIVPTRKTASKTESVLKMTLLSLAIFEIIKRRNIKEFVQPSLKNDSVTIKKPSTRKTINQAIKRIVDDRMTSNIQGLITGS